GRWVDLVLDPGRGHPGLVRAADALRARRSFEHAPERLEIRGDRSEAAVDLGTRAVAQVAVEVLVNTTAAQTGVQPQLFRDIPADGSEDRVDLLILDEAGLKGHRQIRGESAEPRDRRHEVGERRVDVDVLRQV